MQTNHVLIVDGEAKVCEIAGRFLQAKGFLVSKANDGLEALEACASQKPDVVVMDIRMPRMDGVDCLKRIKETAPDTEVIMSTAVEELNTGISCMQMGAFGYLNKPINLENLLVEINRSLEHRRLVLENRDYQINLEKKVEERTREVRRLNAGYHKLAKTRALCTVNELKAGMALASDIHLRGGKPLMKKGAILGDVHVAKLNALHKMCLIEGDIYIWKP